MFPDRSPKNVSTERSFIGKGIKAYLLNHTIDKNTELNISSKDIKVITIFFRVSNPKIPIENKADEKIKIISNVILLQHLLLHRFQ